MRGIHAWRRGERMSSIIRGRGELNVDKCPPNLGGSRRKFCSIPPYPPPAGGEYRASGPEMPPRAAATEASSSTAGMSLDRWIHGRGELSEGPGLGTEQGMAGAMRASEQGAETAMPTLGWGGGAAEN